MPSAANVRAMSAENSASSLASSRGAISTSVTCEPKRANACASSQPIGPPPSTTRRRGNARSAHTVSEVSGPASASPGSGGTNGRAPAAMTMWVVVSVWREPSAAVTSTVHGEVIVARALDARHAEAGVALDGVMRLDVGDDALHPRHHVREVEVGRGGADAELGRAADVGEQLRRAQQRLRRHAARVEAVAAQRDASRPARRAP